MSVQAWFSHDEISAVPGSTLTLPLTIHNLGEATESYTIVPAGLAASWTNVSRGNLTLFGGSQEVIDIEVSPPELSTTTAGPTAIAIRIIPLGDADDAMVAETTIVVEPFDDCRIVALQPIQRARRRATYEFMVENHGNTVASCRLHLIDSTDRVDGDFDPPAVGVAPGAAGLVRLKARAQHSGYRHQSRTLDFDIEAVRQGVAPVTSSLALVQSPTIPTDAITKALAVVALLAGLTLAWFGLVKPTIEDTVASEVSTLTINEVESTPSGVVTTTLPGEPAGDTAVVGEPSFFRLSVAPALTAVADSSQTLPDGQTFDMTDVRIENPFNDRGVATLLINGEQVFVWSLENVRGSVFEPRITPIRLQAGDIVAFSVKCDEIGDATRATCTTAVNIGGEVLAVGEN
ncbi:MAG TPA: hypothetical protein VES40_00865 [Ilumatobacteraceae bacterium]|nr:hypothetical protein [Ilumatobacteraceae bacterium]